MTDTSAPAAVLERLEKLLRLAESPNEHEASAAMAKAQQMMEDFNIDAATIGKTAKGKQGAPRSDEKNKGGLYEWQRDLWKAVAEMNFCRYWSIKGLTRGSTYEHRLLGSAVNVKSTQIMAAYLQGAVERIVKDHDKAHGYNVFAREMIGMREGIADRLCERLRDLHRERVAEGKRKAAEDKARASHPSAAPGNALVVLGDVIQSEDDLNTDYEYGLEPGTTAQRRRDRDAAQAIAKAKRVLWQTDKQQFRVTYGEEDAAAMQRQDDYNAKIQADYELYCQGKPSDTYGKPTKSRPSRSTGVGRTRKPTSREERSYTHEYAQGRQKGDTIGLDQQVGHDGRNKLESR